jgi:MFS family permease
METGTVGQALSRDTRLLVAGQAVRALGYGFTAVVLGALLSARGVGTVRTGMLLAVLIAASALTSLLVGLYGDGFGRRRSYGLFFVGVAIAGAVVATNPPLWLLFVVAVTGTLSTDVVDNGAATTLEQVMMASEDAGTGRVYGWYNAAGAGFGALGALGAAVVGAARSGHPAKAWLFVVLVPVGLTGAACARGLSPAVEANDVERDRVVGDAPAELGMSRRRVRHLAGLFSMDAAGGGLVTTAFLSYYFAQRYHASLAELGWLFFAVSAVQAISVLMAPVLARRIGLVPTMVGTHLPSNVVLASIAFAPTFAVAAVLLVLRTTLSQMDVPTRQALVMTVAPPGERTSAAATTNAARYAVRPVAPIVGGALQQASLGAPLFVAGSIKGAYDLALWRWASHLPRLGAPMQPSASSKLRPASGRDSQ